MKKILSLTLALVLMVFTVSGITAFAAQAPSVSSDTAKTLSIEQGKNYTFKFTISGASSLSVAVGNSAVLKASAKKSGNAYLVTVTGVNEGSTGIYTTLPGQKGICQCTITVQPEKITFGYKGCDYGCTDPKQLNYVEQRAKAITSSDQYKKSYEANKECSKEEFEEFYGLPYSDEANMAVSLCGYVNNLPLGGDGKGCSGSAYNRFMCTHSVCADETKACQAALQANGIDCKLAVGTWCGTPHMWPVIKINNTWYHYNVKLYTGIPTNCIMTGCSYNYY